MKILKLAYFDISRVGIEKFANDQQKKIHILIAFMNFVQDNVSKPLHTLLIDEFLQ